MISRGENVSNKIRVCVDARPLRTKGGISRYVLELVKGLARNGSVELVLISNREFSPPATGPGVTKVVDRLFGWLPGTLWFISRANSIAARNHCRFLWGTQHVLPFFKRRGIRYLVTWHDLVWKLAPKTMKLSNRLIFILLAARSIRNADRIFAISRTTRMDLERFYPHAGHKLRVVYPGKSLADTAQADCPYLAPFLFLLGAFEPRKNFMPVVKAFQELIKDPDFRDYSLVIAGVGGWKCRKEMKHIRGIPGATSIILAGYLSDEEIIASLKACKLFIFPSLYEGFGLPLLEAEGKCAVLANDIPVFRELQEAFENLNLLNFEKPAQEIARSIRALVSGAPQVLRFKKEMKDIFQWHRAVEEMNAEMALLAAER